MRRLPFAYIVYFAATGAAFPYLPVFYNDLGLDYNAIGLVAALQAATQLIAAPLWGGLADRFPHSRLTLPAAALVRRGRRGLPPVRDRGLRSGRRRRRRRGHPVRRPGRHRPGPRCPLARAPGRGSPSLRAGPGVGIGRVRRVGDDRGGRPGPGGAALDLRDLPAGAAADRARHRVPAAQGHEPLGQHPARRPGRPRVAGPRPVPRRRLPRLDVADARSTRSTRSRSWPSAAARRSSGWPGRSARPWKSRSCSGSPGSARRFGNEPIMIVGAFSFALRALLAVARARPGRARVHLAPRGVLVRAASSSAA